MKYWFYIQTYNMTHTFEDGMKVVRHPLASVMSEMKPLSKVAPSEEMTLEREACDRAFVWHAGIPEATTWLRRWWLLIVVCSARSSLSLPLRW
jgi:hypothetical protein